MSTGQLSRPASRSTASRPSIGGLRPTPPPATLTPESPDKEMDACAATACFFLYAQRSTILVLHHDTLAIERRFELHREDVKWISVDNVSERGSGRLAVSYDAGNTAIVWDIFTGGEVARFSAYESMKVASFMRNGNIAFGNDQGNIILFEPSTSEHLSARTIFDPITAIAPSADCRTFAIGYLNGSILIATLQPSFTILHTLTTTRAPSRITGLAWHGSSSKQKTDMLASQTLDGDLRVWSIPKAPHQDPPNVIRILQRAESQSPGPCWFAWSKNGRIVQHAEGETRAWDVRTKKVTFEVIPTIDGVIGISVYGPNATLFTLGRGHTVQQYDITPSSPPMQVHSVQHVPANTPPTPPTNLEEHKNPFGEPQTASSTEAPVLPLHSDMESSADEGGTMSPLQKIAHEMDSLDALQSEIRDKVMPLSPNSSRASSISSRSSGHSRRRGRKYLYDRPDSSRASSSTGFEGTEFSFGGPGSVHRGHDSMSIRSMSSFASRPHTRMSSNLRNQILRSPEEGKHTQAMELFAYTKARIRDVPFRTPHYGDGPRTPEMLQSEMLSVVFGWHDDIRSLIRDELSRHAPGSASSVLLAKWLGDMGDDMASMIGSESMTSSDWMLLALSSIGADSQKKVGEAFVQRLLEKGDIHPAVAILHGLGEHNDAIEVYVSQGYWMEAVLLTGLVTPADWQRQSYLIRKWGENAVQQGQPELAVRCFSCTSIETSDGFFSPRAQDSAYTAQQDRLADPASAGAVTSPPNSPPSRSGSGRLTTKNASLKLITSFGDKATAAHTDSTPMVMGTTPIADTALSPRVTTPWRSERQRGIRDPSSARTATPGAGRRRLPSRSDIERAKAEAAGMETPITAARDAAPKRSQPPSLSGHSRRASNVSSLNEPATAFGPSSTKDDVLPSPAVGAFSKLSERRRPESRDRNPEKLAVQIVETRYDANALSPAPTTGYTESAFSHATGPSRVGALSPPLTGNSIKTRAIDEYINSVEAARTVARKERAENRRRAESNGKRGGSRNRERSSNRGGEVQYIKPAKRSPSSPVPMSPEEIAKANVLADPATTDDESFYKITSPVDSHKSVKSSKSEVKRGRKGTSTDRVRGTSRARSEQNRERSKSRRDGSRARSRSPPLPLQGPRLSGDHTQEDSGFRLRARSNSRTVEADLQARRMQSRDDRARSSSRKPTGREGERAKEDDIASIASENRRTPRGLSRKELAQRELEQRRMSLARRPSAPAIPLPGELLPTTTYRPQMSPRSHTEPSIVAPSRSHTVDPDAMDKYNSGSTKLPLIGLPATPRAMRHPRYMSSDPNERDAPPVPEIPGNFSELSSLGGGSYGSSVSQVTGSTLSGVSSGFSADTQDADDLGPLLPSTVFGQKGPQGPPRTMSAPPEKSMGGSIHPAYKAGITGQRRLSSGRGQVRMISPPDSAIAETAPGITSIDSALHANDAQVMILPDEPVLLPELQHLAGPPPPPPPPTMFSHKPASQGVINIAIDDNSPQIIDVAPPSLPTPMERVERSTTTSPTSHRKGRASVSEGFSRWRGVTERMRSSSRSRAKSPPVAASYTPAPYESVPPMPYHTRHESITRAKSPYELAVAAGQIDVSSQQIPIPPPAPVRPPSGMDGRITEMTIPPKSSSAMGHRRKTSQGLKANMPPEFLQQGVYSEGGFL